MKILFSHQNFPAQFGAFADYLANNGADVTFVTAGDISSSPNYRVLRMRPHRKVTQGVHRFAANLERAMINAQAFANVCMAARDKGVEPDIVIAHSGWGSGTFAKAVWPNSKFIPYAEWYYHWPPRDHVPLEQGRKKRTVEDGRAHALARNAPSLLDLAEADLVFCPTEFQASQFPQRFRQQMLIMHDGVDAAALAPNPSCKASMITSDIPADAEVITYATRGMEPHRGFPEFMRALERLQRKRPNLHAIIGGEDRVAYGTKLPEGDSWKKRMLAELELDLSRIHFVGLLSRKNYTCLLQSTDVHVYLTVPFVLSWSLIEAMSIGCALVASDTPPVREALVHENSALLVNEKNIDELVSAIEILLDDREKAKGLGNTARQKILRAYDTNWIHPARFQALERLLQAKT